MNDIPENVPKWILKAEHDLVAARQILLLETAPTDTVCYHAQQAVEKILKALLIQKNIEFSKTHNLLDIAGAFTGGRFRELSSCM